MTTPWIITPRPRQSIRTLGTDLEIIVGGKFNLWDDYILLDDEFIVPVTVERITNTQGGRRPFLRMVVEGVEFGKHKIQLNKQQPMVFYTNPLY